MTLIKSISGIRGTIGGLPGEALTPLDIVKFASAYGAWIKNRSKMSSPTIIMGRDARISGEMVSQLVSNTLLGTGINVIDLGFATTPTVEIAVPAEKAQGGIILTASHNPKQWNALKLLNEKGEFISGAEGEKLLEMVDNNQYLYADVDSLGKYSKDATYDQKHIDAILALPLVNKKVIEAANFSVVIDAVNSVGGIILPELLEALGVKSITKLYCEPNGIFPHNPEPLPENLTEISSKVVFVKADIGFVVDPDVDRLAIVSEDGTMFGEEYTLVAVADYVLSNKKGNTVSNLSSTRALADVTTRHGGVYTAAAVGEVNVVAKMKETNAVIGGEGNGGIIYPELHYGRDALVGIALFLTHLANKKMKCSELRKTYPDYYISKNKIELTPNVNMDEIFDKIKLKFKNERLNDIDGLKIDFQNEWVHLRKSNTEPIIRIYSESVNPKLSEDLAQDIIKEIKSLIN